MKTRSKEASTNGNAVALPSCRRTLSIPASRSRAAPSSSSARSTPTTCRTCGAAELGGVPGTARHVEHQHVGGERFEHTAVLRLRRIQPGLSKIATGLLNDRVTRSPSRSRAANITVRAAGRIVPLRRTTARHGDLRRAASSWGKWIIDPPSTTSVRPVMNDDSLDNRNTNGLGMSSGCPQRPRTISSPTGGPPGGI